MSTDKMFTHTFSTLLQKVLLRGFLLIYQTCEEVSFRKTSVLFIDKLYIIEGNDWNVLNFLAETQEFKNWS